jgi:predicted MPP superfamily phosphohydrolase
MDYSVTVDSQSTPKLGSRSRSRMMSLAVPLALVGGLHFGLWALLTTGLAPDEPFNVILGTYLTFSAFAIPLGLLSMRTVDPRWGAALSWTGLLALGLFSSLFVLALMRLALLAAQGWIGVSALGWVGTSAWGVISMALLMTVAGFVLARINPAIVEVDIPIDDLPAQLEGFRIVQITDIHVGPTIRRGYMERIVDMVNALNADLVAITGDVVDGSVATLRDHVEPLQHLQARDGVALVLGNHELYSGALAWVQEFGRLGLKVLLNEHFIVRREGATLAVAGVTDHSTGRFFSDLACDPHAAIRGDGEIADVRLLLAHQPITAPAGADAGYHLALHGHTHGGQWWPWNHFVRMQQPVVKGLHRFGRMWSYTSVGTGYWGPPKRHFRSEITLLTLRSTKENWMRANKHSNIEASRQS